MVLSRSRPTWLFQNEIDNLQKVYNFAQGTQPGPAHAATPDQPPRAGGLAPAHPHRWRRRIRGGAAGDGRSHGTTGTHDAPTPQKISFVAEGKVGQPYRPTQQNTFFVRVGVPRCDRAGAVGLPSHRAKPAMWAHPQRPGRRRISGGVAAAVFAICAASAAPPLQGGGLIARHHPGTFPEGHGPTGGTSGPAQIP